MDERLWEILNEVRDLAEFRPLENAIESVSRHYGYPEDYLLKKYRECWPEDSEEN